MHSLNFAFKHYRDITSYLFSEVVCTMTDYDLVREDSEAVSELAVWPGKVDPASKILPKV